MQIYKVGGAVRDQLLGITPQDADWVVVGATPNQLLAQGFQSVGRDFPVFLHPETKEEYALARTERKTSPGYRGFDCYFSPDVTLEEDLLRRDLSINAIAQDDNGRLIDPHGGLRDLQNRQLRHISPAFREDPLRVLRVARFLARLAPLGFQVAQETQVYMEDVCGSGELNTLAPERIWQETERALGEAEPHRYFELLHQVGALPTLAPELATLFGSKIDDPILTERPILDPLKPLFKASQLTSSTLVRFATVFYQLDDKTDHNNDKANLNASNGEPMNAMPDVMKTPAINALCDRWCVPNRYRELAQKSYRYYRLCHHILEVDACAHMNLLEALHVFRQHDLLEDFLLVCIAIWQAMVANTSVLSSENPYPQALFLRTAAEHAKNIKADTFIARGLKGPAIGQALRAARINALEALHTSWQ